MAGFIITYIILALMAGIYVGVNVYHVYKFRLRGANDKSLVALFIYLTAVIVVSSFSLVAGIIAYNV